MLQVLSGHLSQRLGEEGPGPRVPPGVLRLRLLQAAAQYRRGVRPSRGPRALQGALPRDPGWGQHLLRW